MRTLFLQAPSFDGFDGGAGARYQTKREIASFWYPTWLAQPAALVPNSKLIDAPPHNISLAEVAAEARNFDLAVVHTSTPSFASDVKAITALKEANPALKVGLIGAKAAVNAEATLKAAPVVDFAARNEFDFTIKEVADGRDWKSILGLSYRDANGQIQHTPDRPILENMDNLPFVTPVYKRDLNIQRYFSGYLKHPYMSFYTGRGCKSRCTFCLWPQTVGGHCYRTRSVGHVIEEMAYAKKAFPEVKEFFFDDDTFTDDLPRAEAIARELGKLGVTWSCNAKANVPRATLEVLRTTACGSFWSVMSPATSKSCTTSRKACGSTSPNGSPKIAGSSALSSTAHSSWACPARRRRRSRRRSNSPRRSIRRPFRCRWLRPIPGRSFINRRWRTAGSTTPTATWSTKTAGRSRL
jgi:radical SAM superfamily enzyme YgiQ (UPF0313 family)